MNPDEIVSFMKVELGDDAIEDAQTATHSPWFRVKPHHFRSCMELVKNHERLAFDYLQLVTAIDWVTQIEVVYHLWSMKHGHKIAVKVVTERENPRVPSVSDLWPAADWHEREQFDLMGVVFEGHPDLRRILCPEDWEGHPLRKDYTQPVEYHGISNIRKIGNDWYPKPDQDAKAILTKPPSPKQPTS